VNFEAVEVVVEEALVEVEYSVDDVENDEVVQVLTHLGKRTC
jgi:hypothetical protein